jgi:hypothetical protein
VHEVAFDADQVSVELPLALICAGLAEMETVGAGELDDGSAAAGAGSPTPPAAPPPQAMVNWDRIKTRKKRET